MMALQELFNFIKEDLWRIRLDDLTPRKSFWLRQLRVLTLSVREFDKDKCIMRASALTFYTLLSIVPMAAVAFGIAQGFNLKGALETVLRTNLPGQEEVVNNIINFADNWLIETKEANIILGGLGVAALLWIVIRVLSNIERSFNDIWGVKRQRTWTRKFSDYLSFALIGPIVFIISSSMTVAGNVEELLADAPLWAWVETVIFFSLKILPFLLGWGLFTFAYLFMPNTKVKLVSGLIGGIIAGTLYQIAQVVYVGSQMGLTKLDAIYGGLAALPFFLLWLQLSWLIVLYGAEISFAHQNIDTYEFEPGCQHVKPRFQKLLSLNIVRLCVEAFDKGEEPLSAHQLARSLTMPIRLINQLVFELVGAKVLAEVKNSDSESVAFQPARNIERMTILSVLGQLDERGIEDFSLVPSAEMKKIEDALTELQSLQTDAEANLTLKNL